MPPLQSINDSLACLPNGTSPFTVVNLIPTPIDSTNNTIQLVGLLIYFLAEVAPLVRMYFCRPKTTQDLERGHQVPCQEEGTISGIVGIFFAITVQQQSTESSFILSRSVQYGSNGIQTSVRQTSCIDIASVQQLTRS